MSVIKVGMKRESTYAAAMIGVETAAGAELVRLLDGHDRFDLRYLGTARRAGVTLGRVHPHLDQGDRLLYPADINLMPDVDIVFSDVAEGDAWKFARDLLDRGVKVVDLGYEFRFDSSDRYQAARRKKHPAGGWSWQYGLAETLADDIANADAVSVPGAVAAAVALTAGPPLNEGLIAAEPIIVDVTLDLEDTLACAVEAEQALELETGAHPQVTVRMSEPRARRIGVVLVTAQTSPGSTANDLVESLVDAYRKSRLILVTDRAADDDPVGTARTQVGAEVDPRTGVATLWARFDPLLFTGPGLAVRCANLMLGLDPLDGIPLAGLGPL